MMTIRRRTKTVETITFVVHVRQVDIDGGRCGLKSKCMHKIAIERRLRQLDPGGGDHKVRCDGQLVKFNFHGWHYQALLPKSAKMLLIQFDKERLPRARALKKGIAFVSKVPPHSYRLEGQRGTKVRDFTEERMAQVYSARRQRRIEGKPDKRNYDLRYRIEGLGAV
jgi:hypothetical protein